MKKTLLFSIILMAFSSCNLSDLTRDLTLSASLPFVIETPATQNSGTYTVVKTLSVSSIDSLLGMRDMTLTGLTINVLEPSSLTFSAFTHVKATLSYGSDSLLITDRPLSISGRVYESSRGSQSMVNLLLSARQGDGKVKVNIALTTNTAMPLAKYSIMLNTVIR